MLKNIAKGMRIIRNLGIILAILAALGCAAWFYYRTHLWPGQEIVVVCSNAECKTTETLAAIVSRVSDKRLFTLEGNDLPRFKRGDKATKLTDGRWTITGLSREVGNGITTAIINEIAETAADRIYVMKLTEKSVDLAHAADRSIERSQYLSPALPPLPTPVPLVPQKVASAKSHR
jgi:hypothetical protein